MQNETEKYEDQLQKYEVISVLTNEVFLRIFEDFHRAFTANLSPQEEHLSFEEWFAKEEVRKAMEKHAPKFYAAFRELCVDTVQDVDDEIQAPYTVAGLLKHYLHPSGND